jgi:hypothetical protein
MFSFDKVRVMTLRSFYFKVFELEGGGGEEHREALSGVFVHLLFDYSLSSFALL